ncbi:hypothetical protein CQA49_09775, partial [Helicobacter sp. MIT 00-7814]
FNEATDGGNIRTAEHGSKLENLGGLKSTEATLNNLSNHDSSKFSEAIDTLSSAIASEAGKKAFMQAKSFEAGVKANAYNEDGSMQEREYGYVRDKNGNIYMGAKGVVKGENGEEYNYKEQLGKLAEFQKGQEIGATHRSVAIASNLSRIHADETEKQINELEGKKYNPFTGFVAETFFGQNANQHNADIDKMIEKAKATSDSLTNARSFTERGLHTGVGEVTSMINGVVANLKAGGGNTLQGGMQSGVSFSHNSSRNYSFGTNISGGDALAGLAMSMGMSAGTYGATSSAIGATAQVAGAAAMFLPGGAAGKTLANVGAIGAESTMAIGVGRA